VIDTYYAFDFSRPPSRDRAYTTLPFRHNEFNLNLGLVDLRYDDGRVHGRLALHTGTYAQSNYALESPILQHVHETYTGVRLGKTDWWVDMGIFGSHIGFEGAVSMQQWNYSRAIMADFSPYYEAGLKLSGPLTARAAFAFVVVNGWQNIKETNEDKAVGTQLQFQPNDRVLLNWSTFLGNEMPDNVPRRMRLFNDWYGRVRFGRVETALIFDLGLQKRPAGGGYDVWHTAALLTHTQASSRVAVGTRVEYYADKHQVIIATGPNPNGFQTFGASVNLDYAPASNLLWRIEARGFRSKDAIYPSSSGFDRANGFIVTSIAVRVD
jgi:hypothetical protein